MMPHRAAMNPFKSRLQAIAFTCVSVAVILASLGSIAVAHMFMPSNAAGRSAVVTFYRCFVPMAAVWAMLGCWSYCCMQKQGIR